MQGEVKSLNDAKVSFVFKGNTMTFPVSEIEMIQFGSSTGALGSAADKTSGMKGVSFVLEGREIVKPPVFENLTLKKGIVVVAVHVDKYGNVKKAEAGAEKTTTTDDYLLKLAQSAAMSTKFNNCPKCPLDMQGTMTFTF